MNDKKARFGAAARVVTGQSLISVTSFATILAVGRWGGEAQLGVYALGWSCWLLAMSLSDTLILTPYTFFHAQRERMVHDLPMAAAWSILVLCCILVMAVTLALQLGAWGESNLWPSLPVALAAYTVREAIRRHCMAAERSSALLRMDVASGVIQVGGVVLLGLGGHLTAENAFWSTTAGALCPIVPWWTAARARRFAIARNEALAASRHFLRYGYLLFAAGICHVASVQAYPWIAFAAGGAAAAGIYAACNALLNAVSPILSGLTNYFRPRFMMARTSLALAAFPRYVHARIAVFIAPALLLWLVAAIWGRDILAVAYGPTFAGGASALAWLGGGTIAVALAAPFQLGMLAMRATGEILRYHLTSLSCAAVAVAFLGGKPSLTQLAQICCCANLIAAAVLFVRFETLKTRI